MALLLVTGIYLHSNNDTVKLHSYLYLKPTKKNSWNVHTQINLTLTMIDKIDTQFQPFSR